MIGVAAAESSFGRFDLAEGSIVHTFEDGAVLRLTYAFSADGTPGNDVGLRFSTR